MFISTRHELRRDHSPVVIYWHLTSNGRLLWLHNSSFEEIYHIIFFKNIADYNSNKQRGLSPQASYTHRANRFL